MAVNRPPTADAGTDQAVNEGATVTLDGSGSSDPDSDSLTYSWASDSTPVITRTGQTPTFTAPQVGTSGDTITFTLTVSDGRGGTGTDTVDIRINDVAVNRPPTADAGTDQAVNEGATVTLDGSGSSDPDSDSLTYSWASDSTPVITRTGQTPTFTAPQVGTSGDTITFTLTVSDGRGGTGTDTVDIRINDVAVNRPPTADAGTDQAVNEGATVTLDGSGSSDPDSDSLTYSWASDSTPVITRTGQTPTFTGRHVRRHDRSPSPYLTGEAAPAPTRSTSATVNRPPTADAGTDQAVNEGATVTLDGSGSSDPDSDSLTYSWASDSTPVITRTGQTPTFTAPQVGTSGDTITFTLTVSDGRGGTGTDTVDIRINDVAVNRPPTADAGTDQAVNEGATVTLDGSGSSDPDSDSLTYSWASDSTPVITRTGQTPTFTAPQVGTSGDTITFTLTVSDGRGGTGTDTVTVTVNSVAPLPASARSSGSSITLTMSEIVTSFGAPPNGFSVESGGDSITVGSITGSGTKSLVLGLTGPVSAPATLSYSGNGDVTDEGGNPLASFADLAISFQSKSKSTAQPPAITIGSQGHPQAAVPKSDGPLAPVPADGTPYPLTIGKNGYPLNSQASTVVPTQVAAGQPVTMSVTIYDPTPIAYFVIYLNLQGSEISHLQSDAQIIWNYGQVYVVDRGGLMRDVTVTMSEDPDDPAQKTFTFTVTLSEGMGQTNMAIRTWNAAGQLATVQIFDAIDVRAQEPEPVAVDPEPAEPEPVVVDPEPAAVDDSAERDVLAIRMWSGFEPESISDAQLLASLGLDYPGAVIPNWVMTELGPLVAKGDVTTGEFKTALEYVLENS